MSSSASSAVPPRQSNFELLRIIAMFMILVVHADFWLLGLPTLAEFHAAPAGTWTRILIESASIGCVNIFILISGWFSIRVSVRGFCSFLFQCAFFLLGFYLLMIIAGQEQPGLRQLAPYLCFTKANWFIKAYIGLYILAPMLNLFAETATKRQLALTLLAFYSFQTLYGWTNSAVFVEQGYSTFSFIGLYLLARYLKLHGNPLRGGGMGFFAVAVILNSALTVGLVCNNGERFVALLYSYANPLVIVLSVMLLLKFAKLRIPYSPVINRIGKSSFAVFLFHANLTVFNFTFRKLIAGIYASYSGIACLFLIFCILAALFFVAVLIDQFRIYCWNKLENSGCWKKLLPQS